QGQTFDEHLAVEPSDGIRYGPRPPLLELPRALGEQVREGLAKGVAVAGKERPTHLKAGALVAVERTFEPRQQVRHFAGALIGRASDEQIQETRVAVVVFVLVLR